MAKQKLEAELGLNTKDFEKGFKEAIASMGKFGKEMAGVMAAVGAAGAAIGIMLDWFKKTEEGARIFNKTAAITKQILQDIMMQQQANTAEAARVSDAMSKQKADDPREAYEAKKLQSELNQLVVKAADNTLSLAEKKNILNEAMEKEKELKAFLLKDAKEEMKNAYDFLMINQQNIEAKRLFYEAAAKVREVEGMDSRRLQSQFSQTLVQQANRAKELFEVYSYGSENTLQGLNERLDTYNKELEDININDRIAIKNQKEKISLLEDQIRLFGKNPEKINNVPDAAVSKHLGEQAFEIMGADTTNQLYKGKFAEQQQAILRYNDMLTNSLSEQEEALLGLEDVFAGYFSNITDGFDAMIGSMLDGLKRLIAEMAGRAVFFGLMSLLKIPMGGTFLENILPGIVKPFVPSLQGASPGGGSSERLVANIRGKDIQIALQRG